MQCLHLNCYMRPYSLLKLLFFFPLLIPLAGVAQSDPRTELVYSFDDHSFREAYKRTNVRTLGAALVEDRFGNDRSAAGLNGHINSYVNLGVSPLLKPKEGSISLWINLSIRLYNGKGSQVRPIILTKNGPVDDWYEAFCIYVNDNDRSFVASSSRDSLEEAIIHSNARFDYGKWYHLVLTIGRKEIAFYMNGELQGRCPKRFETHYLATDSLMIGHTANGKNQRFIQGAVDDIHVFHRVLSANEVKALYEAPNPNKAVLIARKILTGTGIVTGISLLFFVGYRQRNKRIRKANERLELNRRLQEMEMRTLKAQMNPHFLFNALNSIQLFVHRNETKQAKSYLSTFSILLRHLLESSTRESTTIEEEQAIIDGYLAIESLRFGQSFSYAIRVDDRLDRTTRIPHMMIQPFVENAIWHGLLPKESDRHVEVTIEYERPDRLRCRIDDNGVGREAAMKKPNTFKHHSLALSIVRQRLELMNRLFRTDCGIDIIDKTLDGCAAGTCVIVTVPVLPE